MRFDVCSYRPESGFLNGDQFACLEMVSAVCGPGRHNMTGAKVQTCGVTGVDITNITTHRLGTYDFDGLTTLVLKAHQRSIRVEVLPHTFKTLRIRAFKREPYAEELNQFDRHPSLEQLADRCLAMVQP
jgi:hypothetical protein